MSYSSSSLTYMAFKSTQAELIGKDMPEILPVEAMSDLDQKMWPELTGVMRYLLTSGYYTEQSVLRLIHERDITNYFYKLVDEAQHKVAPGLSSLLMDALVVDPDLYEQTAKEIGVMRFAPEADFPEYRVPEFYPDGAPQFAMNYAHRRGTQIKP